MENNDSFTIDQWLDALIQEKITLAELEQITDKETFTQVLAHADVHKAAVNIVQRYNVLQQIKNVHTAFTATPVVKAPAKNRIAFLTYFKPVMKIAAVLILVTTSAYLIIITTTTSSSLYANLSQEYYVQTNRTNDTSSVSQIVKAFNDKQFEKVITVFNNLNQPSAREYFLVGYAYLQTGNYTAAVTTFKSILDKNKTSGDRLYNDEAEYYLALSYIQLKQYDEAYVYAKSIKADQYHTYHEKINNWLLLRLKLMR